MKPFQLLIAFLSVCLLALGFASTPRFDAVSAMQKLKPEELVAKHLEALGSADERAKVTARVASGSSNYAVNIGGSARLSGSTMLVSAGARFRFGIRFPTP